MNELIDILKVLGDEKRIRIIKLLEAQKMCVCEMAYVLEISQPAVSKHLKKMMNAGVIESEKDGFWTNYFLKPLEVQNRNLLRLVSSRADNESVIAADKKRAKQANRIKLCCK